MRRQEEDVVERQREGVELPPCSRTALDLVQAMIRVKKAARAASGVQIERLAVTTG
jgi:hypothetical protein